VVPVESKLKLTVCRPPPTTAATETVGLTAMVSVVPEELVVTAAESWAEQAAKLKSTEALARAPKRRARLSRDMR
jgi:magnesium-transporting ATPase (P-type)